MTARTASHDSLHEERGLQPAGPSPAGRWERGLQPAGPFARIPGCPRKLTLPLPRAWQTRLLPLLLVLALVGPACLTGRAGDPAPSPEAEVALFETANRRYEEGQFQAAAELYESLLARGIQAPNLHFNLANARLKSGQLGQAIAHYRLAARLAPRDPDIQANLRHARSLLTGQPPPQPSAAHRLVRAFTVDEWTLLAAGGCWAWFGLLAWREWHPARAPALRRWLLLAGLLTATASAGLLGAWHERGTRPEAVVVVPEAVVRYGPLEVSPPLQTVHDGLELAVLDEKDGWLQVTGLSRGTGWIRASDLIRLPR